MKNCGERKNSVKAGICKQCKTVFMKRKVQVKAVSAKQFSYHKSKLFEKVCLPNNSLPAWQFYTFNTVTECLLLQV